MASVTIELGSGKRATLTRATGTGGARPSPEQSNAVSLLMLHWPKYPGLTTNAQAHLRQLGLSAHGGAPLDVLRYAIEAGRVAVAIEQPVAPRGAAAGGQPSRPPYPLAERRARVRSVASVPMDEPQQSWARPSDVTADDLINYLQSVLGGTGGALADTATETVQGTPLADASQFAPSDSPLGDAQPFEYASDLPDDDGEQIAGMPFNGTPGSWASSMPGTMRQLRQYGPNGTPMTDIDFEAHHGNPDPHAHNWDGTTRDEGAPVSILPW